MRTGQNIRATYTDAEKKGSGVVGTWQLPGIDSAEVITYRYPSRCNDDFAELRRYNGIVQVDTTGRVRSTEVRRDDQGDGWHVVTYLIEYQRAAEIPS